ncbi:flagellar basal body-associated FliL family protein, partial [Geminicoccus harenae]
PKVIFIDLPDVLVNLSSDTKRMRFLKLRLAVEVSSQATANTVVQYTPRIMDSFQLYLRSLTVDDLGGPSALHRLKQEMLARINLALDPGRIDDVLFKEMLVQ